MKCAENSQIFVPAPLSFIYFFQAKVSLSIGLLTTVVIIENCVARSRRPVQQHRDPPRHRTRQRQRSRTPVPQTVVAAK